MFKSSYMGVQVWLITSRQTEPELNNLKLTWNQCSDGRFDLWSRQRGFWRDTLQASKGWFSICRAHRECLLDLNQNHIYHRIRLEMSIRFRSTLLCTWRSLACKHPSPCASEVRFYCQPLSLVNNYYNRLSGINTFVTKKLCFSCYRALLGGIEANFIN